jgi:hypothetical protein
MLRRALLFILLTMSIIGSDDLQLHSDESFPVPILEYLPCLGGKGNERGAAVALDSSGGIYVGGADLVFRFPGGCRCRFPRGPVHSGSRQLLYSQSHKWSDYYFGQNPAKAPNTKSGIVHH